MSNGITDKEDITKAVLARRNYERQSGIKRDENGNVTQGDPDSAISNEDLIDLAVFNQSVSDSAWGDPTKRQQILDGLYQRLGSTPEAQRTVERVNSVVSSIKNS